jgi:hypothetical protein
LHPNQVSLLDTHHVLFVITSEVTITEYLIKPAYIN